MSIEKDTLFSEVMHEMQKTRPWAILAAGAAIQVLTGLPAAWGVFQGPVMEEYGLSEQGAGYAFGVLIAFFGIGCVIGGFLQDKQGPRFAALWGTGLLCWRILRGGGSPGREGECFFRGVQHPGRARHGLPLSVHPVLRPEVVQGPEGPRHRRHRGRSGVERSVPDRLCPHGAAGLRAGAGHPGRVLGAGCADPAGLPRGQCIADRPAARKASAQPAGKG